MKASSFHEKFRKVARVILLFGPATWFALPITMSKVKLYRAAGEGCIGSYSGKTEEQPMICDNRHHA
jgi:hypothetical protein